MHWLYPCLSPWYRFIDDYLRLDGTLALRLVRLNLGVHTSRVIIYDLFTRFLKLKGEMEKEQTTNQDSLIRQRDRVSKGKCVCVGRGGGAGPDTPHLTELRTYGGASGLLNCAQETSLQFFRRYE